MNAVMGGQVESRKLLWATTACLIGTVVVVGCVVSPGDKTPTNTQSSSIESTLSTTVAYVISPASPTGTISATPNVAVSATIAWHETEISYCATLRADPGRGLTAGPPIVVRSTEELVAAQTAVAETQTAFGGSKVCDLIIVPDALATVEELVCADSILYALVKICNDGSHQLKTGTPVAFLHLRPYHYQCHLAGQHPVDRHGDKTGRMPFVSVHPAFSSRFCLLRSR